MKKSIFILAGAALVLAACNPTESTPVEVVSDPVTVTPAGEGILAENISPKAKYAVGSTELGIPAVWNIEAGAVVAMEQEVYGELHAVTDDGIGVGGYMDLETYATIPILFDGKTGNVTELYCPDGDGQAYGITKDGKTIVGYYYDETWTTHACLWTENGATRTDLPVPTEEQTGFAIDYCSARYISEDGKVVLGYVQDNASGAWVATAWEKQADGNYAVNAFCKDYFQAITDFDWDTWTPILPENPNPYIYFEPSGLSANGEWVLLIIQGVEDENYMPARYNLKTNVVEPLDAEALFFGVANDGTAVGRLTEGNSGLLAPEKRKAASRDGVSEAVIWEAGKQYPTKLAELYPEEATIQAWAVSQLSGITGDGRRAVGFAATEEDTQGFMLKLKK